MKIKDILTKIGYMKNAVNLLARKLRTRIKMSSQFVAQLENEQIVLTVKKLLKIFKICNFSVKHFFQTQLNLILKKFN
ncbi:MAG: hypothetical protein RR140_02265 [Clostridia bacterium]